MVSEQLLIIIAVVTIIYLPLMGIKKVVQLPFIIIKTLVNLLLIISSTVISYFVLSVIIGETYISDIQSNDLNSLLLTIIVAIMLLSIVKIFLLRSNHNTNRYSKYIMSNNNRSYYDR